MILALALVGLIAGALALLMTAARSRQYYPAPPAAPAPEVVTTRGGYDTVVRRDGCGHVVAVTDRVNWSAPE